MKLVKRMVPLLLACALIMATPAFARASDQISSYYIDATPMGNGEIIIEFSITAPFYMQEIGAKSVSVFEVTSTNFVPKATYTTEDDHMISTDTWVHDDYVTFYGEAGKEYYIIVTIYAKDYDGGSDSRHEDFMITAT